MQQQLKKIALANVELAKLAERFATVPDGEQISLALSAISEKISQGIIDAVDECKRKGME